MHHTLFTDLVRAALELYPSLGFAIVTIVMAREFALAHDGSGRLSFAEGWIGGLLCAPTIPLGIFGYWVGVDFLAHSETISRLLSQI